jgi:DNA replicative helicase MCM subunit Mcm2 (Cdc46/Mcm family)
MQPEGRSRRSQPEGRSLACVTCVMCVAQGPEGELDTVTVKKFASYCRTRCAPRLSPEASETLASEVRP